MPEQSPRPMSPTDLREKALSRWENEGGAGIHDSEAGEASAEAQTGSRGLTSSELIQLRIRVIALENVVMALLAGASDERLMMVREMAAYIAPTFGFCTASSDDPGLGPDDQSYSPG